ncbi:hypothetical protein [Bradyrhizobium sp. 6(2017)]|uniref:hypothetical protein n=1 Tax=Bradyrhizobium sp. 6(2017) TaxID=1197460 RepID=UPI0013E1FF2A|nr:hypothetical protein [Bradyrhizobium sp. 6(2017)]QIG95967.1 hypothetical protein G6P99_28610 [Bradyrhizobium sp. 6(2017)]
MATYWVRYNYNVTVSISGPESPAVHPLEFLGYQLTDPRVSVSILVDPTPALSFDNLALFYNDLLDYGFSNPAPGEIYREIMQISIADSFLVGSEPSPSELLGPTVISPALPPLPGDPPFDGLTYHTFAWAEITLPTMTSLFTTSADIVNFKSLTSDQRTAIIDGGANLYSALNGNDSVTLPDTSTIPGVTGVAWSFGQTFNAGPGNDTVAGGVGDDKIAGGDGDDLLSGGNGTDILDGGLGSDSLYGGVGLDVLSGDDGADLLDGGDGNDSLFGGNGNDTVAGGAGNDTIDGGLDSDQIDAGGGDDLIFGSPGNDVALGGDGVDVFDYQTGSFGNFQDFTVGTTQALNGGANPTGTGNEDVLRLPGAPNNYSFSVTFGGNWANTRTEINYAPLGPTQYTFNTKDIERVTFANPVSNQVDLARAGGSIAVEMMLLAQDAYGKTSWPKPSGLGHDPLAYEDPTFILPDPFVSQDNWHPVSALELGLKPENFDQLAGPSAYSFVDGRYSAIGGHGNAESNALVLTGVVNGVRTLSLTFRGTDQYSDFLDYLNFNDHYARYQPLIKAIHRYINDPTNGITSVLVSGHSLGAAMVQYFMRATPDTSQYTVRAWTDGSPGSDEPGAPRSDSRIENFVHTDDPVTKVPFITQPGVEKAIIDAFAALGPLSGTAAAALVAITNQKFREGSNVLLNSDIGNAVTGLFEHSSSTYTPDVAKLYSYAKDAGSPFSATALGLSLASNLASNNVYTGPQVQVAVGTSTGHQTHTIATDAYVLGGIGPVNDDIFWNSPTASDPTRTVDAGAGTDTIILKGTSAYYHWNQLSDGFGTYYDLIYNPTGKPGAQSYDATKDELIGRTYRVENLMWTGESALRPLSATSTVSAPAGQAVSIAALMTPTDFIVHLDGTPVNVQTFAAGSTTITLSTGYDYADTGDGDQTVTGTASNDVILIGSGNKNIDAGDGDDVLMVKIDQSAPTTPSGDMVTLNGGSGDDIINAGNASGTVDGGAGADVMIGGYVNTVFYVDNALDQVSDPSTTDHDTVVASLDYVLPDGVEELQLTGDAQIGIGNAEDNTVVGNGGDNALNGLSGSDTMVGGAGNDTYFVDDPGDVVTEGVNEGTDIVHSSISYALGANLENLTLAGTENISGSGNSLANAITGNAGDNVLNGAAGPDGLTGGLGNDTYYVDDPGDIVVENTGEGTDTVHTTINYSLTANVENLVLDGSGNLFGIGNALANVLTGNSGSNLLYGGDGNDTASGGAALDVLVLGNGDDYGDAGDGNDYIYAGAGNDVLIGGTGLDVLLGEDGNDVEYGGSGFNYLFGGAGTDTLIGSGGTAGSDVNVMYGEAGADYLYGGQGTNYFYGGTGVDTMFGGSGLNIFISSGETDGNVIYGGSGQNYVYGSNGGDTVTGGSGVDVFLMGTGADQITGGGWVDYAWGGGGTDTFNISDTSQEIMVVQDFNTGGVNDFVSFAGTSLHSFADVQAAETYVAGINTTIITDAAGSAVWLIGIAPGQLDASMFKFA